ncbi:MAG: hypothetical protein GTN76_02140, partial [Candidatus Aenigmarchaeota archaeon]|nr:hypothetical protein [Candidatus Aenigmarchaeota archaeon]
MATYLTVIFIIFLILIFLGIKWEIKLSIVIPWAVFMAVLGSAAVLVFRSMYSHTSSFVPMAAGLILSGTVTIVVTLFFFFRDPERDPPDRGGNVLAPADGKVVYVKEIKDGEFPFAIKGKRRISLKEFTDVEFISGKGIQIGIAMNLLNVHV